MLWLKTHRCSRNRAAFLLPIVLVVVAMLSLAVSIFAEQMLAEYRLTHSLVAQLAAGNAADSGIEFALATTVQQRQMAGGQSVASSAFEQPRQLAPGQANFAIVRDYLAIGQSFKSRAGLANESGKLNLNSLPTDQTNILPVRERLMKLPRMTPQVADAIMDWIDSDDQPRPLGAETSWYSAQQATQLPAQGPLRDLSDLLYVRGVTSELLYGEDTNGNHWLDDNENDGALTPPLDNADGRLDRGWSAYLTVVSSESNMRTAREPKIDLNQSNLVQLYDQLLPVLGQDATTLIVALRLEGPRQQSIVRPSAESTDVDERVRSAPDRLKRQLESRGRSSSARTLQLRNGLDLSAQPNYQLRSLVDLIDCEVLALRDGSQDLLRSPWDTGRIEAALEQLERVCFAGSANTSGDLSNNRTQERVNLSRINILHAPTEVLHTVPTLDLNLATAIATGVRRRSTIRSIGWLVNEGLLTLEQLRQVGPYLTVGGDVWSGSAIGWDALQPIAQRRFFVIDSSPQVSGIRLIRDGLPIRLSTIEGLVP